MRGIQIAPAVEAEAEQIHAGLRAYNRGHIFDSADLSFVARDGQGAVLGGVEAWRVGDYAMVDVLWVDESRRGAGLGRALLETAERTARDQGVRHITLNTFRFQAPGFYEKQGYRLFGEIPCADGNHCFYVKEL